MRRAWGMAAIAAAMATAAAGAQTYTPDMRTVPTVIAASAKWAAAPDTITVSATVQLNDSCWSGPQFVVPLNIGAPPTGDVESIAVMAHHDADKMCAQVVRNVVVPAYDWHVSHDPNLTRVTVFGDAHPVTVVIRR